MAILFFCFGLLMLEVLNYRVFELFFFETKIGCCTVFVVYEALASRTCLKLMSMARAHDETKEIGLSRREESISKIGSFKMFLAALASLIGSNDF